MPLPDSPRAERHLGEEVLPDGRRVIRYDPLLALRIVERIAEGETLRSISKGEGMPSASTFNRWVLREPVLQKAYKVARELAAQSFEEEALDLGRAIKEDPSSAPKVRAYEVLMNQLRWSAEKRDPAQYGPRAQVNVKVPIQINTTLGLDPAQGTTTQGELERGYKVTATVERAPEEAPEDATLIPAKQKPRWAPKRHYKRGGNDASQDAVQGGEQKRLQGPDEGPAREAQADAGQGEGQGEGR